MRNETTFHMIVVVTSIAVIGLVVSLGAYLELGWGVWVIPVALFVFPSIAYAAYDVCEFANGVHRAYKQTVEWRPRKRKLYASVWQASFCVAIIFFPLFWFLVVTSYFSGTPDHDLISGFVMGGVIGLLWGIVLFYRDKASQTILSIKTCRSAVFRWNPIAAPFTAVYYIWRGVCRTTSVICKYTPKVTVGTKKFVMRAFYNVHSEGRRAVFADTSMCMLCGFLVGIPSGSMIAGALTGLVVGPVLGYLGHRWMQAAQTPNA